jgi:hypothetical protein
LNRGLSNRKGVPQIHLYFGNESTIFVFEGPPAFGLRFAGPKWNSI